MTISDEQLYQLLADLGYLAEEDLKQAQKLAATQHLSLYDALLQAELLTDENLGRLVADSLHLPFVQLSELSIPDAVLHIVPRSMSAKLGVIAFEARPEELKLAVNDPAQTDVFVMLAKKSGSKHVSLYYATARDLHEALQLYRARLTSTFEDLLSPSKIGKEVPVVKVVDTIIEYAYHSKASDIHIEPTKDGTLIRFRIDGVLHDMMKLPSNLHDQLTTRIKVLSRLRTDEHLSAQDGKLTLALEGEDLDVRVSIVPIVAGEKVVLRLLTSHFRQLGLADLGMSESDLTKVRAAAGKPYGMILSTGPTGSGKTTSMYAILKILNTREKNIATIEDPVEYQIEGLNQIQVNPKANLTFATGLRSILRQDPNIIYVGEIRDEETADIAVNSAMTGHLVLSTLHTNDSGTALPRLLDMGIEPFLVASTVNAIIAQRLVRQICEKCKVSADLTLGKSGWTGDEVLAPQLAALKPELLTKHFGDSGKVRVYRGKGCNVCHNTGYTGRIGIFEVMVVSAAIQTLITTKANSDAMMTQALKEGMTTMMDDGLVKVRNGVTTIEEVLRMTTE
ncbi:MAG TPA: GspE/PulE family protein [Candidatus Saccharimonas sp.]|nr:GspE/PulE family protein [Candidatus Saccharimonas sp.]